MVTKPRAPSGSHRRRLRALAHHLEPLVQVGKEGVSPAVLRATDQALTDHELVKVRLPQVDKAERTAMAEALSQGTQSTLAGVTGRVAILYRRHPEKPQIEI